MDQLLTGQKVRYASELTRPFKHQITEPEKLDVVFLFDVVEDFPMLFTDEYKSKFGS